MKNEKIFNSFGKRKSINSNGYMTQMLEFSDKDLKLAVIKYSNRLKENLLKINKKTNSLSKEGKGRKKKKQKP